ncbi:hypothetical protein H477_2045 [[Clostridium] sordellii ATCC 9714]|nr:hypothetical protein H477_2045 [[Clostridium] sordellii ATCC 9714] [Paeniclostridium sordellii ATCC 9714]
MIVKESLEDSHVELLKAKVLEIKGLREVKNLLDEEKYHKKYSVCCAFFYYKQYNKYGMGG